MGKRLFRWEAAGFLLTAVFGPLLHMAYEWSGKQRWTTLFSAVNESTWEHMKLLFVPVFLWTLVQFPVLGREYPNFLAVRASSLLAGLAAIPTLFYIYQGVLGWNVMWVDVAIFFAASWLTFWLEGRWLSGGAMSARWRQTAGLLLLFALAFAFVWWTYAPPALGLWRDPVTCQYGIPA